MKIERDLEFVAGQSQRYFSYPSTTKIKSLIHSCRIIVSDTRKKIDGVAVATARFSDAVAGQLDK